MLITLIFTGICIGSIYSIVALSLNLTFWTSKTFNFSQGSLLMFSPMSTLAFYSGGLNLWISILLGILIAIILGYIIELFAVRPLLHGEGWMVTTLGFAIILQALASSLWGAQISAFPAIIFETTDYLKVMNVQLSLQLLLILVFSIIVMIGLNLFMKHSIWGKAMWAVSEDPEAARLLSINATLVISLSFIVSASMAGLAGVLISPITGISPGFGLSLMINGFIAAVIGGMGNAKGAMIGGLLLGVIEFVVSGFISTGLTRAIVFAILILMLSLRPYGLFGEKEVARI